MREPGLSFARLLSSRVRLPAYAFMRTLGQENGSCQTQIFTAVYLFFPLTQIQPLPNSQGKPCAQGFAGYSRAALAMAPPALGCMPPSEICRVNPQVALRENSSAGADSSGAQP